MATVFEKMTAIADAIRDKTGGTEALTLDDMATDISKVYDKGKKSQYDEFWDTYQQNGNRENYEGAFYGPGWNNETFKPKYDIAPSGTSSLYAMNIFRDSGVTGDLKALLEDLGIIFDTSQIKGFSYTFYGCMIEVLPLIDMSYDGETTLTHNNAFENCKVLKTLPIKISEFVAFSNCFRNCVALENLQITGTLGQNGFDVSTCINLTRESLLGIIAALKDYSGTGTVRTVSLGATNLAKLTDGEKAIATQKGWTLA